jgi:glycosyltransferase involved in cell wall biosynthesis
MQTPLLIFSDSPSLPTGLGRIARDLATHIANDLTEYRVGTFGRAGVGSRELPFQQYDFGPTLEDQWGLGKLETTWDDFAGSEQGIILTIQDASRMLEFARPDLLMDSDLKTFLQSGRFERWGYFPIDSTGPDDRLTGHCREALKGYGRVLGYTKFGAGVLSRSLNAAVDYIPHGLDLSTFQPRERKAARIACGFPDSAILIGCNMTNQYRKDWGLWANVCSLLKGANPNFRFWAHIDTLNRNWNLDRLIQDYNLSDVTRVTMSGKWSDLELSYFYSACDATFLPSLGEGFGYPIAESMACGVPCVHGDYAGGAELTPSRVAIEAYRLDTPYNCIRPVYNPMRFVERIQEVLEGIDYAPESLVEHLDWKQLWPACWKKWFRR